MLRTIGEGGGEMKLPPWYDREAESDADALFAWLDAQTGKDFGEVKRGDKRP